MYKKLKHKDHGVYQETLRCTLLSLFFTYENPWLCCRSVFAFGLSSFV